MREDPDPRARRRRLVRWSLRAVGLGLVAFVLVTQVQWTDVLVERDGTCHRGTVRAASGGGYDVRTDSGGVHVSADHVAVRAYGGREMPDVSYGLPSLARRLSDGLPTVGLVLALLLAAIAWTGWRWLTLLEAAGLRLPLREAVRLNFVGSFFNIAVPGATGGDVVKAYYAAKATGAGTRAVLSVFVDRAIGLFGLALFAAGALFLGPGREGYGPARTLVGILLGGGMLVGVLFLSRRVRTAVGLGAILRRLPFQRVLREADAALVLYRSRLGTILLAIATSLVNHAVITFAVWLLARALHIHSVDLGSAMVLVPVACLLSAVPLLPGGWGVGELAFAYFFGQVGVPATEAVALSVVFRLANLAASLPGGALWVSWKGHPSPREIAHDVQEAEAAVEPTGPPAAGRQPGIHRGRSS